MKKGSNKLMIANREMKMRGKKITKGSKINLITTETLDEILIGGQGVKVMTEATRASIEAIKSTEIETALAIDTLVITKTSITEIQDLIEILIGITAKIATHIRKITLGTINIMTDNLKNLHHPDISQNMRERIKMIELLTKFKETQYSIERIGLRIVNVIKKTIHIEIPINKLSTNGRMIEKEVLQVMETVDITLRKITLQVDSKMITINLESIKNLLIILM